MFWTLGGTYLMGLQVLAFGTFAWSRWMDPSFAHGSGFWVAGLGTMFLGLLSLGFETVGLFWSHDRSVASLILRGLASGALIGLAAWGLGPFGQAALMRLTMTGSL